MKKATWVEPNSQIAEALNTLIINWAYENAFDRPGGSGDANAADFRNWHEDLLRFTKALRLYKYQHGSIQAVAAETRLANAKLVNGDITEENFRYARRQANVLVSLAADCYLEETGSQFVDAVTQVYNNAERFLTRLTEERGYAPIKSIRYYLDATRKIPIILLDHHENLHPTVKKRQELFAQLQAAAAAFDDWTPHATREDVQSLVDDFHTRIVEARKGVHL